VRPRRSASAAFSQAGRRTLSSSGSSPDEAAKERPAAVMLGLYRAHAPPRPGGDHHPGRPPREAGS
jgi:hypothetical protein